jgi:uncharacterized protein YcbK (DUF882 family)
MYQEWIFMAISMGELLSGNKLADQSAEIQANLADLLGKINQVRGAWAKSMTVTSGLRSKEHHIQVYKDLASQRKVPFDLNKVPMGSKHLTGQAVDISDPDGSLFQWTKDNESLLAQIGLWMEEKDDQHRVHFQSVAPKSGNRWFNP